MAWTLCTSGSAVTKAGLNADATLTTTAAKLLIFSDGVEGDIVTLMKHDVVDDYANLDAGVQYALEDLSSNMIAMRIIAYDIDGYGSRTAGVMLDFYENENNKILKKLQDADFNKIRDVA